MSTSGLQIPFGEHVRSAPSILAGTPATVFQQEAPLPLQGGPLDHPDEGPHCECGDGQPSVGGAGSPQWLSPTTVSYTAFNGDGYEMQVWKGTAVALLAPTHAVVDATVMEKLVAAFDAGWGHYAEVTGRSPAPFAPTTIDGLATIAVVDETCGAGCGYLGFTGIEIDYDFFGANLAASSWDGFYDAMRDRGAISHIVFYEMGRNYWLYDSELAADPWTSGFAAFTQLGAMLAAGAPIDAGSAADGADTLRYMNVVLPQLAQHYLQDGSANWEQTLLTNAPYPNPTGFTSGVDLGAAILGVLSESLGSSDWQQFWRVLPQLSPANSDRAQAMDNIVAAATSASDQDYSFIFKSGWSLQVGRARGDRIAAGADDLPVAVIGLGGHDELTGRNGYEFLLGGQGNDLLSALAGSDDLSGGPGQDTLLGGGGADVLSGGDGHDFLSGDKAADVLIGGVGADSLQGGSHADVFRYESVSASRKKLGQDLILDLTDDDLIDVSAIDADAHLAGDQAFSRVRAFSGEPGELRLIYKAATDRTILQADVDGDRQPDLTVLIVGQHRDFGDIVL